VQRGLAWGTTVANDILTWRATDGFAAPPPPYAVGSAPGDWQPTPPLFLRPPQAPLFRQFAAMTPFALTSPSQFLPPGPPPLTSARYAQDLAQVQALGSASSTTRTVEQTQTAIFWQDDTPPPCGTGSPTSSPRPATPRSPQRAAAGPAEHRPG
jgi:hypothetical protein